MHTNNTMESTTYSDDVRNDQAHIGIIVNALEAIATSSSPSTTHHEIEARLGTVSQRGSFVPGVDPEWFEALCLRLEKCNEWCEQKQWSESEDTSFNIGTMKVRQSRICDSDNCIVNLHTIRKTSIAHTLLKLPTTCDATPTVDVGADTIKIAHSSEEAVHDSLPTLVRPLHVRIKQRREFLVNSTAIIGAKWRFDMTRTWSGRTREEAETLQNSEPPVCEVELEWIPPPHSDYHAVGLDNVAQSLLTSMTSKLAALQY